VLGGIVRLQLDRIGRRIEDNHDAVFLYDETVVEHIVSLCNDPDSGGRMIDNIITNTLLPALSREFLRRSLNKEELTEARVTIENGDFAYHWGGKADALPAFRQSMPESPPERVSEEPVLAE
jgi:type VI secretion system protein VasG